MIESPEYVEPLSAFAIGKAVKFPDTSMIKMQCHLRFCDRLLGECDAILVCIFQGFFPLTIAHANISMAEKAANDFCAFFFQISVLFSFS